MSPLRKKLLLKFLAIESVLLIGAIATWQFMPSYAWIPGVVTPLATIFLFWYLVSRPFNKILKEFKALLTGKHYNRIYTEKVDEIGVVAHFFNEITHSLERVSTDIKEHRRISSELNVAQKIQKDLLPQSAPDIPGLDIIAKTKPAAEIGGDSFDFITKGPQTFMYIGDVTGHGVPSGLVMMIVDTLIHTFTDMVENSKQLLVQTNRYLKPRIQSTMFMTMIMMRWEHQNEMMHYTGAGHESLIHYHADTDKLENIKCGGIALGMVPDNEKLLKEESLHMGEGDFLILYSDGIVEAQNNEGEMFGTERLLGIIKKQAPQATSAEMLFTRIAAELTHFLGEHIQKDDMTMVVIRKGPKPAPTPAKTTTSEETKAATEWDESNKSLIDYSGDTVKESGLKTDS